MIKTAGLSLSGSSEKAVSAKAQGEELIEVYCIGSEYQSDKKFFRALAIDQKLSQDEKLKVDYNYNKFKEIYEAEMEKLETKQRGF